MWSAVMTEETVEDVPQQGSGASVRRLATSFVLLALQVAVTDVAYS